MSIEKTEEAKHKKVGQYAILIFVITFLILLGIKKNWTFNNTINLYLLAGDVTDISTDTKVLINGFQIGKVNDINLHNESIILKLSIGKDIKIGKSAIFKSYAESVFGRKNIRIEQEKEQNNFYLHGDTIEAPLIDLPIKTTLDSFFEDPALKKLSKDVGKALEEYGNSK